MNEDRFPQTIFHRALEMPGPMERAAYIAEACGGDGDLRREVESLLAAHEAAGTFLEPLVSPEPAAPGEQAGDRIGHYKLLELIGEGGFGRVWMAEQTEPVKRRVALKVIRPGMDSKEVIARFEAERQALALMDHPNIAPVYEAGATDTGRPYFVMELVDGVPITDFCDRRRLPTRRRLELFLQVCQAVQHAHQKAIIHRDLKPSNILVTLRDDKPVPKVIDFGIAKAISRELTERTLFTAHGQLVGTPQYMSPEQADLVAPDVDTRSDVYSLGVLLYELLTGVTPIDPARLRQAGLAEIQRLVREEEPPKPSTRIGTLGADTEAIAQRRSTDTTRLSRTIRGDLDWIVMKALDKDRARRYETANAFAADVQRFLGDEAVLATPPSFAYQFGKYARRHRGPLAAAAVIVLCLVAGAAISTWQAGVARRERDDADRARQRTARVSASRKAQLQEAARTDRLAALEMLESGRERDAFAFLARACDYDPESSLAAETAVFYLNTTSFAREVRVLMGEGEFPIEPMGRSGLIERRQSGQWSGAIDAAFSPNGRYLISNALGLAHLWNAQSGRLLETISVPPSPEGVGAIDWRPEKVRTTAGTFSFQWPWDNTSERSGSPASPDGVASVTTKDDKVILDYRGSRGGSSMELPAGDATGRWARFSSDSLRLAAIDGARVNLCDVQAGKVSSICVGHAYAPLYRARFNRDGDKLVTTSEDTTIRIWETAVRNLRDQAADIGMDQGGFESPDYVPARVLELRLTSDGRHILGLAGGMLGIWDAKTGELLGKHPRIWRGLGRVSPDGKLAVISDPGSVTVLLDLETGEGRFELSGPSDEIDKIEFSPDSRFVATHGRDSVVRVWDVESGRQVSAAAVEVPEIHLMMFSPDGTLLHISCPNGPSVLIETTSGRLRTELEQDDPGSISLVRSASFSPDGTLFVTGGQDAVVRVWHGSSGRLVATVGGDHPQTVLSAEFSPDGTMLATACWRERVVQVWDTTTWRRLSRMFDQDVRERVVWSPDSRLLTAGSDRAGALHVWHARSGELVARLPLVGADLRAVVYAPDGKSIVTAARRGGPYIWEAPAFTGPPPPWFADFLRWLVQRKVGTNGRTRSLSPGEVDALLREVETSAVADGTRYGEIARWFLAPAAQRPVRPGMALARHELADRLVTPTASPDQLMRALDYDPANVLAHLALARFVGTKEQSGYLRRWARERLPPPIPAELQQRIEALESITFQPEPLVALPDGFSIPETTISPDRRYGVSILVAADQDGSQAWPPRGNELVQLEPLRVLATIEAGYERNSPGHERITSRWTKDSSGLLWIDKRESFPRAMVYLRLEDSKVLWQQNLLDASKSAISDRCLEAFPAAAAAAGVKAWHALPSAFRIDIELPPAETDPSLPLQFAVSFDSHPEDLESARFPLEGEIVGSMAGVLDQDGRLIWSGLDVATGQRARGRRTARAREH